MALRLIPPPDPPSLPVLFGFEEPFLSAVAVFFTGLDGCFLGFGTGCDGGDDCDGGGGGTWRGGGGGGGAWRGGGGGGGGSCTGGGGGGGGRFSAVP